MTFIIKIINFILNAIYLLFKCFRRRKQITLISRESNNITTDFKLLSEEMKKELPDYKIVVLCKKMDNKLLYAFHMLKQMYHISRSKVIILDTYCYLISNLKHKKDLVVIQIWHAIGICKKAGYAIVGKDEGRSEKVSKSANMHKNYTYVYTTSKECIPFMAQVFNCDKSIIRSVPLPRIDLLKDKKYINSVKNKIYKKYPSLKNKINVLYAPTFRKDNDLFEKNIHELINNFDYKKYNLIIKLHPLCNIKIDNDNVFTCKDFSTSEMIYISDYVISDYSSIIYEAGIMNKKMIFYAFDLNDYSGKRDFFIDYKNEVPGPICYNSSEVISFLKNSDYTKYKDRNLISKYVDLNIKNYTKNMVNEIKKTL